MMGQGKLNAGEAIRPRWSHWSTKSRAVIDPWHPANGCGMKLPPGGKDFALGRQFVEKRSRCAARGWLKLNGT